MKKKIEYNQIVIRIKKDLDKKIESFSEKSGLTKASWARQLIIREIEQLEAQEKNNA